MSDLRAELDVTRGGVGSSPAPASLAEALHLSACPAVAIVGAGGKTSALADLARSKVPCVAAATTHMGEWQVGFAGRRIVWPDDTLDMSDLVPPADDVLLVTGPRDTDPRRRLRGLRLDQADILLDWARAHGLPLFVEADGSRQLPLKAPAPHEPPIPALVDLVLIVAGLSGIGRALNEASVHRVERFAGLSGCAPGSAVTVEHVARVLAHPDGGLRNVPPRARRVVLLNQADTAERQDAAAALAPLLLPHVDAVVVAHRGDDGRCRVVSVYQ